MSASRYWISGFFIVLAFHLSVPKALAQHAVELKRPRLSVQTAEYAEPLESEQTVALEPSVLNPASRPWVITRKYRYDSEQHTLHVDLVLHARTDKSCGALALNQGRKSLEHLRNWLKQQPSPQFTGAQAESVAIARWSRSIEDALTADMRVSTQQYPATDCAEPKPLAVAAPARKPQLLARAPIKWWEGRPSVRVQVEAGGVKLNGHFLVDLGAAQSSVSPMLLDFQGVPTDWFADPSRSSQLLPWVHRYTSEGFPADEGRADRLSVANLDLRAQWLRITESEVASTPRSPGACCDGVLGLDALREYPVEWRVDDPGELLFWEREGFDPGPDYFALIVRETSHGALYAPHCQVGRMRGVRFLTSLSQALEWSTPHASQAGKPARVSCSIFSSNGTQSQWNSFADYSQVARLNPARGDLSRFRFPERDSVPAAAMGMEFLARSRFILDLPHGKIWFHRKILEPQNSRALSGDWGGQVEFRMVEGERQLWWRWRSGYQRFWESNLSETDPKVGQWVRARRLNGIDLSSADLWWIQKTLRQSASLELEWELPAGLPSVQRVDQKSVSPVTAHQFPISRWKIRANSNRL